MIPYFSISETADWNLHKVLSSVQKELCFRQEQTWFSIIIKVESVYFFTDQSYWSIKECVYCKDFLGGFQVPKFCICRYRPRYEVAMQNIWLESCKCPVCLYNVFRSKAFRVLTSIYTFCTPLFFIHVEAELVSLWEFWYLSLKTKHSSHFMVQMHWRGFWHRCLQTGCLGFFGVCFVLFYLNYLFSESSRN